MDSNLEDGRLPVGTGLPMNGAAKASPPAVGIPDADALGQLDEHIRTAEEALLSAQGRIGELEKQVRRLQREKTDEQYMRRAIEDMLGPVGSQVAKMYRDSGLCRVHYGWLPGAEKLTGEERAQVILNIETAEKRPIENVDGDLTKVRFDD